ncbi:vWA domain-containing protein [Anoxynatronum buryatiense]|uniref:VWA domain-containing protein n=1 Tax=Anoxynatronum buryatiense TaxID=489973 RepID=A0AA45WZ11_9CLOT|nr:hypothetical protein [Anoxynatronum buryatiense]SMP70852.1 hypothetical protein SAMN06296020_12123 [Anoxynatronum buryatiense]
MKTALTELVFILDRSGSMSGLEQDTIGGYNNLLERQKQEPGEALVTTVLFDDRVEVLHDRLHLQEILPMTAETYYVRGTTALLDAVGTTINKVVEQTRQTPKEQQPQNTLFVITTDGMENASREFEYEQVRRMIEHQKEHYNWEFLFLGANIDAVAAAKHFGICEEKAVNYHADIRGTQLNYLVVGEAVSSLRANNRIDKNWKKRIDEDFKSRR